MKYDFNTSTYAKLWESKEAQKLLIKFINDKDIIQNKQSFWKTQFDVDPTLVTRQPDGTATFSQAVRKRSVDNMLDWRAPLGESMPRDKKGLTVYQGSIPDFIARGFVEQAMEREARIRMFEAYFGNDAQILAAYADSVQEMVDEANSTVSNLAAQSISTGRVSYNHGAGIRGNIYEAPIPAENRVKAGALAWATTGCKLLDQMSKIEMDYRERTGSELPLKWQVTRDTFMNVILANEQVVEYVTSYRTVKKEPVVSGWAITPEMFNEAFASNPKISPIEVVSESQRDGANNPVHGWADNIAVLRPRGAAGVVKRADILDKQMAEKYGSSVINEVYGNLEIFTLVNTTLNNGRYKEWHTDLLVSAVPVLDEIEDHIIVNTAEANA